MNLLQEMHIATKKILLIDNELNVSELVEHCLIDLGGWNLVTANCPLQALERAEIDHPDAIVLDLSMRGSFMFLQQIKHNIKTKTIPIVVLSANARWLHPEMLQQYKIVVMILKPLNPVILPSQITKILNWYLPIYN